MKKESFKLNTKIGQPVYYVEINVPDPNYTGSSSSYKEGIFIKKLKIVYQTKYKIALSNEFITTLDRQKEGQKKESYYNFLEDMSVTVKTKETYWPNGIFAHCYTIEDPEKSINKLKRKMIDQVNKDYGFLRWIDIEKTLNEFQINKV